MTEKLKQVLNIAKEELISLFRKKGTFKKVYFTCVWYRHSDGKDVFVGHMMEWSNTKKEAEEHMEHTIHNANIGNRNLGDGCCYYGAVIGPYVAKDMKFTMFYFANLPHAHPARSNYRIRKAEVKAK